MDLDELDWPPGPSQTELRRLDELARCPVCHDFYRIPLSLSCGHTYCSTCIRGNLDYQERQGQAKCPQCRHPCDTRDLRPCLGLKDLVETYFKARQLLIQAATQTAAASQLTPRRTSGRLQKRQRGADAAGRSPQDRQHKEQQSREAGCGNNAQGGRMGREGAVVASTKSASTFIDMTEDDGARKLRARPAASKAKSEKADAESDIEVTLTSDSSWGSGPPSQRTRRSAQAQRMKGLTGGSGAKEGNAAAQPTKVLPGYVQCPVCTMQLRETLVNDHIDKCLQKASDNGDFQEQPPRAAPAPVQRLPRGKAKLEVPPKLVFSMLSNKELQAKLKAHKLPTDGKRHDWEQRYNKFRVEVQCAQDAGEDVTLEDIARRLGKREKQTAAAAFAAPRSKPTFTGAASFEELISRTRKREATKPAAQQEPAVSLPEASPSEPSRERQAADEQMQPPAGNLQPVQMPAEGTECQQDAQPECRPPAQSMDGSQGRAGGAGKAEDRLRPVSCLPLDPLDPNLPVQVQPAGADHARGNGGCMDSSILKADDSRHLGGDFRGHDDRRLGCEQTNAPSLDEVPDSDCDEA